ncbi:MAG: redox-sensitive transcriptional activator SoxR [Alphaproteobacteria bacterium]|nr:redox-sensitive transcriptional activator SoxR [Alphaproteobacteria bacterium]MBU0799093.1 redox-sensitive transcriptional activator SoxR [Alphaproteobacteria bacterium]MBU0885575.1 redox-sensitive transcriptional activator SoxR [Alphaproteobacteria bacterium]MBU1813770.1 redox-sensitive transcriptional activator SoxR [Alphaproteobacteria bacterium]MBU2089688.1 redox-sensitive transcriptional activator SoxR [Alphaproteobacteria bacterium]
MAKKELSVGELSRRSGLPVSTLHFYERRGLIASERTSGNHRVYRREILRRVTVIKVAQSAGIPLAQISEALSQLPRDASPDTNDWERIAENWHDDLTRRIELLTALRDKMAMCIGCGCLSVQRCPLVNPDDQLAKNGPGARLL